MTSERLFLLDPYNDSHLEKLTSFEKDNNMTDKPSDYIKKVRETTSKEEYYNQNKNELDEIIFTEKTNKITDACYIHCEKDIKTCKITPLDINNKNKRRHLPELATNYALDTLGMEEVFVNAKEDDNNLIIYLELKGYENLGEENGSILLLKEKEEKENSQRMIS